MPKYRADQSNITYPQYHRPPTAVRISTNYCVATDARNMYKVMYHYFIINWKINQRMCSKELQKHCSALSGVIKILLWGSYYCFSLLLYIYLIILHTPDSRRPPVGGTRGRWWIQSYRQEGHTLKAAKPRARLDIRLHSFSHKVINCWNNLPDEIVECLSINNFKFKLGMLLSNQHDFIY